MVVYAEVVLKEHFRVVEAFLVSRIVISLKMVRKLYRQLNSIQHLVTIAKLTFKFIIASTLDCLFNNNVVNVIVLMLMLAEMWLRTSSIYLIIWCSIIPLTYSAIYSNLWAVHIKGGERVARSVAEETGFVYLNKFMDEYYHFQHHEVKKRSLQASHHHHSKLTLHPEVHWVPNRKSRGERKETLFLSQTPNICRNGICMALETVEEAALQT
ncbi:FURIN [Bugula neritina]|uniref:FURIN n=1 Tax=Bugula neritina TaxID=10212 RepID=A0A7J7JW22_BUGNE|nr:FURIN [Bugula neritina]